MYHLNKTLKDGNTYWKCDKRWSGSDWKAKVALDQQNNFWKQYGEQTHPPEPEKVLVEKSRSAIKRKAIETNASINNIIAANIVNLTDNVPAKLPRMETMRRDVRRQHALTVHIHLFRTMKTFYLMPHNLLNTEHKCSRYDNHRTDRIIIFAKEKV